MLPYFVLFGFLAVLFLADKYDDRFKTFVFWISGLALVIFSGTRIGMGRDYRLYEHAYQFPDGKTAHNFELVWQWINKAFHSLGLDFHAWLFFVAFVTILLMFIGMKKMSKDCIFSVIAFVLIYRGYFETMNMVRQYVAMAIVFASFPLFLSKKYVYFYICIGTSALFHVSALAMLILVPLATKRIDKRLIIVGLVVTWIFGAIILEPVADYAATLLPERYGFYIKKQFVSAVSSSGLYQLFLNSIAIFFLMIQSDLEKKDPQNRLYIFLYVVSILIYNTTISFEVAMRIMFYPFIFIFILLPNAYIQSERLWQRSAILAILAVFTFFMLKDLSSPSEPYANYKSILF
ncbi:exopolysaccharide biosynthesis protein [Porphyromonas gulae]|uniref:EpsG family protein n=1 Tax=Porphyromonas gulae TaxID=111105 RepID=UPI00052D6C29|nr:EpsG family protein [Porphyromonas gulae]KGO03150.1 exopolysaccharide biosynthesis protein [Porphyromonas gulae]